MTDKLVSITSNPVEAAVVLEEGYYEVLVDDNYHKAGDLVYLTGHDNFNASFVAGDHRYSENLSTFMANYRFRPDGKELREQQLRDAMQEFADLTDQAREVKEDLANFNPHIDAGKASDTAIAVRPGSPPVEAKRALAGMKNSLTKLQDKLTEKQATMQAYLSEQSAIMKAKVGELTTFINKATEAIWSINLYLGHKEDFETLSKGAPAPDDTPLSLRQLVLYMDEECKLDPEKGGIDATEINKFDHWIISKPEHLAQVLPEIKGVVAIKVRRTAKQYESAWANAEMAQYNKKTYFLLRNGENLYRLWVDYDCGETMLPTSDEFTSFFRQEVRDYATGAVEVVYLQPGTEAYAKAEKNANDTQRHYLRMGLILQGLIDRTTVFRPMAEHIQVTNPTSYGRTIEIIRDAEALSDGHERYSDWIARVNKDLAVGMRIVGAFHELNDHRPYRGDRKDHSRCTRLSPMTSSFPEDDLIYTLEGKREGGFYFYFKRDSWQAVEAYRRRGSCRVMPTDQFILNVDAATLEEMEYFLSSRLDRHNYIHMIPVLKWAIELKKREAEEEQPFLMLLAGEIMKAYCLDHETASAMVPEIVAWWKFKNRTHRSLLSDDSKALEMIVKEAGLKMRQDRKRRRLKASGAYDALIEAIMAQRTTEPLLVAHKSNSEFIALIPADDENIFVHEETWKQVNGWYVRVGLRNTWRTVDNRYWRWDVIYTSQRWSTWKIGASRWEYLSDPESMDLIEPMLENIKRGHRTYSYKTNSYEQQPVHFISVNRYEGHIYAYYYTEEKAFPETDILTAHFDRVTIREAKLEWKRNASRDPEVAHTSSGGYYLAEDNQPWKKGEQLRVYQEGLDAVDRMLDDYKAHCARVKELGRPAEAAMRHMISDYVQMMERRAYHEFITEFGDPDLWEGHKKTLRLPNHLPGDWHSYKHVLNRLLERGHEINGITFGAACDLYQQETPDGEKLLKGLDNAEVKSLVISTTE